MPKFVSESSGHIYAREKHSGRRSDDEEDLSKLIGVNNDDSTKKPSAINKKGTKEKQRNSLDLFKEELRRLQEEKEEQKKISNDSNSHNHHSLYHGTPINQEQVKPPPPPTPVPLKPDPRCPTPLTLKVPKCKESSMSGSFDNGDPTTTNLYLGNVNPAVNENDLCDLFGKFGSLASIKIMWPRTDEERARNRNSGFVAYMNRKDAEVALKTLSGIEFKGYAMKLGKWLFAWTKIFGIGMHGH